MWHWQNSCTYVSPCCSCRYTDRFRSELTHSIHCHICRATHAGEFRAKGRPPKLNAEVADAVFAEVTRRAIGIDALPPGIAPLKEVRQYATIVEFHSHTVQKKAVIGHIGIVFDTQYTIIHR